MGTRINRLVAALLAFISGQIYRETDDHGLVPLTATHTDDLREPEPQGAIVERALAATAPPPAKPMPFNNSATHYTRPQEFRDPSVYSWVQGPSLGLLASAAQAAG